MPNFLLEHTLEPGDEERPWGDVPAFWDEYCRSHGSVPATDAAQVVGWHFGTTQKRSRLKIPIWFSITPRLDANPLEQLPVGIPRWLAFFDSGNDSTLFLAERHLLNLDLSLFWPMEETQLYGANPLLFLRRWQELLEAPRNRHRNLIVRDAGGRRYPVYRLLADIWIYSSRQSPADAALRINTGADGISIYLPEWDDGREIGEHGKVVLPESGKEKSPVKRLGPPFPLIGMRALERAGLSLTISCKTNPGRATISS